MTKYGVLAHRKGGKLPAAIAWCKDDGDAPLVFDSREEAEKVAAEYNENLKRDHTMGPLHVWYTVSPYTANLKGRTE